MSQLFLLQPTWPIVLNLNCQSFPTESFVHSKPMINWSNWNKPITNCLRKIRSCWGRSENKKKFKKFTVKNSREKSWMKLITLGPCKSSFSLKSRLYKLNLRKNNTIICRNSTLLKRKNTPSKKSQLPTAFLCMSWS